jgi:hypothetical protein
MRVDLLERFMKKNPNIKKQKREEIVDELMNKLKNYKNLADVPKVLKLFFDFDSEYNI